MADSNKYGSKGMHNGDKSRIKSMTPTPPNKKIEKRVKARLDAWEKDTAKLKTKGRQKPGSQSKVRGD